MSSNQMIPNEKNKTDQNKKKKVKSSHKSSKNSQEIIDDPIIQEKMKQATALGDIDDEQYNNLSQLFTKDPFTAINESKKYLKGSTFSDVKEYIEKVRKTQKTNCCLTSWNKPSLACFCLDCQIDTNCCVCIPCYLEGKHYEHHSYIKLIDGGSCDCGNPNNWKISGNCDRHKGADLYPDLSQMEVEDRKKFITVFKSAFFGVFSSHDDVKCSVIFQWMKNILQYGDGIRRCCSIAISSLSSKFFFTELLNFENESILNFIDLLYNLISDLYFMKRIGSTIILNYTNLIKKMQKFILEKNYDKTCKPYFPIKQFCFFSYNFFNEYSFMYLVNEKKFNWVDFLISSIKIIMDTVLQMQCEIINNSGKDIVRQISYLKKLIEYLIKIDEQHENLQNFIDNYSNLLINYESKFFYVYSISDYKNKTKKGLIFYCLLNEIYGINSLFCADSNSSEKNKNFAIDKTFSSLVTFIKSEQNLRYDTIYTLRNEVPVVFFLPVHHLFYCLSSSYQNISEIISLNCNKNDIQIEDFCLKASVYPTRLLISILASERFEILAEDVKIIINTFLTKPEISFNKFFGLYQILLSISNEKEKMLSFLALTFAIFISAKTIQYIPQFGEFGGFEYYYIIKEQLKVLKDAPLEASYFIMSVLTDRSIISFDKKLFKRLRIMELLIIEKASIERIEQYGLDKIENPEFSDDLITYTERVQLNNGKFYYRLKNENDFQPFFPFIVNRSRNNIFNKFTKNLIPLVEYKDLPNGLSLKECFRTPTFIILMKECLSLSNNLAATQVGLSMFIMAMLNGDFYDKNSYVIEKPIVINYFPDLIDELIELRKTLKEKNLNFSMIMFTDNELKKYSIFDLVKSKEQLGHDAIKKANIPVFKETENDIKENKKNVNSLKLNILKEFEQKRQFFINSYALNEAIIFSDERLPSKCLICNNDIDEISGYQCFSIPSILPSLINRKLYNLNTSLEDLECVFSLVINHHPVHFDCDQNRDNENDGERKCLLPIFSTKNDDIFKTEQSAKMREAMDIFMIKAFDLFEIEDNLIPVKSFVGMVSILEVRHRNRPDCFDRLNVSLLLRNLLLTLYFSYHKDKIQINTDNKLLNLVLCIINSNSPIGDFKVFVKNIASEFNDDVQLFEFLRRSAIIEEFALKVNKEKKFVDWDEVLSFESLLLRFEIIDHKAKSFELPLFQTIPLSEKFIELYQPPFNLDIFDYSVIKFVDLLTGQVVVLDQENKLGSKYPSIFEYVQNIYHKGLAMFLCLTGKFSTQLVVHMPNTGNISFNGAFYVDRFGGIDSGFKRGSNLHLSHEILENDLDRLLSGNFII